MKSLLAGFSNNSLTRTEMKAIKGGGTYTCVCGNLASTPYSSGSAASAQSACSAAGSAGGYGSGCTARPYAV